MAGYTKLTAATTPRQEALFNQRCKGGFECVRAGSCFAGHVAACDAAMIARVVQNRHGQLRQRCQRVLLALHLYGQPALLLLQGAQEKPKLRLPVRMVWRMGCM